MSRPNQIVTQFPALDHEPRGHGPPPSYRNSAATEDSWSTASGVTHALGVRNNSWANIVKSGEDPIVPKQAPPRPAAPTCTTFSIGSRTSSEMVMHPPTVFSTHFSETVQARVHTVRYIDESAGDSGRSTSRDTVTEAAHGQAMPMQKAYSNEPRLVSVPRPAGTIQSSSNVPSRAASVLTSSDSTPPMIMKNPNTKKTKIMKPKRNRLQEWKRSCCECKCNKTSAACGLCFLLLAVIAIVIIIILSQVLPSPKEATFNWVAPSSLTNGQNVSSRINMKVDQERIRFQMTGAAPMKGNFINYYDFNMNQVVIIDQSLSVNGKNLYCFIVPLNRQYMPDPGQVRKAAKSSVLRHNMDKGWEENWQWIPSPLQSSGNVFNPPIPECNGSRIVQLQQTSDQRNRRCTDCYDFCLPEYGIMRDAKENNEEYLNIVDRDCFYLFVPEWRTYSQANTIEQNQQDFETYYRNRQHMQVSYGSGGPNDSRWIPLSGMPKGIMNATGQFVGQVGNAVGQLGSNVYGAITGQQPQGQQQGQMNYQNGQQQPQQQQMYPNGFGNGQPPQQPQQQPTPQQLMQQQHQQNIQQQMNGQLVPSGYHPAVNGVVNLNGGTGNNGNTEYNTNQQLPQQQGQPQAISPDMRRNAPYSLNSHVNSGYSSQGPRGSGSTFPTGQTNGFGAQPSYQTQQFGFSGNDARNGNNMGMNGRQGGYQSGNNNQPQQPGQQQGQLNRIGSVLNEFGNPVTINAAPNQNTYNHAQTSMGFGDEPLDNFSQKLQQVASSMSGTGYQPNTEPVNYNVPIYNQPNRHDALSRQGRIFK